MNYPKITAYSTLFVAVTWGFLCTAILFTIVRETFFNSYDETLEEFRHEHLQQHDSEQEQFLRMIELLEQMNAKLGVPD